MRQNRTIYKQPKMQVRLTESELHQVINEAVEQVLIDEGFWGGVNGVRQAAWDGAKESVGKSENAWNQGSQQQDMNNMLQSLQQAAQLIGTNLQAFPNARYAKQVQTQLTKLVSSAQNQGNQQPMQNQPTQQGGAA